MTIRIKLKDCIYCGSQIMVYVKIKNQDIFRCEICKKLQKVDKNDII